LKRGDLGNDLAISLTTSIDIALPAEQHTEERAPVNNNQTKTPYNIQERAFQFACRIVRLHQYLDKQAGTGRIIAKQMLESGTSIGANLEEADAGQSKRDFVSKCGIALKEARETFYWLQLLLACDLVPESRIAPLVTEANELVAILTTIVKNARI
jgi:four helix bundle protein